MKIIVLILIAVAAAVFVSAEYEKAKENKHMVESRSAPTARSLITLLEDYAHFLVDYDRHMYVTYESKGKTFGNLVVKLSIYGAANLASIDMNQSAHSIEKALYETGYMPKSTPCDLVGGMAYATTNRGDLEFYEYIPADFADSEKKTAFNYINKEVMKRCPRAVSGNFGDTYLNISFNKSSKKW